MAKKRTLSKRKNYTGRELGQLEIANYAYMYEHRTDEDQPKTLFDLQTFIAIARDLAEKDPAEYAKYTDYQGIVRWLGKYSNITWGYNGQLQLFTAAIEGNLAEAHFMAVTEYTREMAAAAGLTDLEAELAAAPLEAVTWYDYDLGDTVRGRLEFIQDTVNGYLWGLLDCYYKILAFNKALEIIAEKYEVPEVEAFNVNIEDQLRDVGRLKESADRLEALRQRLPLKDLEEPLKNIIFDYAECLNRQLQAPCYTEESIAKVKEMLDTEEGLATFIGGLLMDTLYVDPLAFMTGGNEE